MRRVLKTDGVVYIAVPATASDEAYTLDEIVIGGHLGNDTITNKLHGNPDSYRSRPHWTTNVPFTAEDFSDVIVILAKVTPR